MKSIKQNTIIITLIMTIVCGNVIADSDEMPGVRKFNEIVRDINKITNETQIIANEIEKKKQGNVKPSVILPEVKRAKDGLEKATENYKRESNNETSKALKDALICYTKATADFVEAKAKDLRLGIDLLSQLSNNFAKVNLMFIELEKLAKKMDMNNKQSKQYLETERQIVGLADMIDSIEKLTIAPSEELNGLRQTLEMQAKLTLQEDSMAVNMAEHLRSQQQNFSQLQAQVNVAKNSLIKQKSLLARIAQYRVTENMLLKASYLLLGKVDIKEFAKDFQKKNEESSKEILDFAECSVMSKQPNKGSTKISNSYLKNLQSDHHMNKVN